VEIPLVQKSILHLGHPSYATTVVLSTLLLGSGLGAWVAGRAVPARTLRWRALLPAACGLLAWGLPGLLGATLAAPLALRVGVSVALLAPLGFAMGFAFPLGMLVFAERSRAWFWAMNGLASVLASVTSVALAGYTGFSGVVALGAAAYAAACLLLVAPASPPPRAGF
jgi:hypothetical protein